MDLTTTKQLNNGLEMPIFGLGVFRSKEGEETYNAVRYALDAGYRHIDTAAIYGNELSVGKAIKDSGIPRKDIFITTKLWNENQRQGKQMEGFEGSLERLGVDYVDLYLIHWPVRGKYVESWKVMEKIYQKGGAKAIGVSNFHVHHLQDIFAVSDIVPAVNQVELHPHLTQIDLVAYCKEKGIAFEPWSPLAAGTLLNDPTLQKIADKYGKNIAQVILRWDIQQDFINIPKSVQKDRIIANAQVFDFELTEEDMRTIFAMNQNRRTGGDPETFTF